MTVEHYRKVHMKESEYLKTRKGSRSGRGFWRSPDISAPPATYIPVVPANEKNPVLTKATEGERTVEAYRVPPSGDSQIPGLSTEAVAPIGSQQPFNIHETLPGQKIVGLKASVSDSDEVRSTALDAHNVRSIGWSAKSTDDVGKEPSKGEKLDSCSDNRSVHEQSKHSIFDGYRTRANWEYPSPSETISDGDKPVFTPTPQPSIKVFIKDQVLKAVAMDQLGRYCASLKLEWDVMAFMEDQFHDGDFRNTMLGPVVTISGSVQHAEAATCSEYIRQHWPAHGSRVLDALQDALKSPSHTSRSSFSACNDDGSVSGNAAHSSHAELEFDVNQEKVCLNIKSESPNVIVDVVQQLAWMGAALRTSVDGRVQYCEPKLAQVSKAKGIEPIRLNTTIDGVEPILFNITFDMSSPGEDDQSCWFPLFQNAVIAHRFSTTPRNEYEVGLEIPLDMMAALGGARHVVDFEGGLVLKGYSTLFVPIKRHEDSVQWHLICARGEDRISYNEASARCPNRALLEEVNHEGLKTTRAFLGWWKDAETHLATADADYGNIDWSKAKEAGTSPRLTGGTLGVSKIFSAQVNFVLGAKDGPYHYMQQEPFQKTIDRADRLPIILYDQKDRTAWLVPALPVILHIIQLRNYMKPFVVGGSKVQISPLDPSRQGHAAKEAVARNKSQKLFDCETHEEKDYCFRDAILDTWSILDRLMEKEATTQATPGMAVHATWQDMLYGWEFKAVADEDRHLKQKVQVLEKTAGRWRDLVKDVDAVVLFASGFGDIIKPRSEQAGLCRKWRRLQRDKDYLAVCVPMLENFYAKAGHRQDQQYLTSAKLQWHRGSMLFEQCADTASDCCKCDRLQQVYRDSYRTFGRRIPPGNLEPNGCVVFGQANHSMKRVTKPAAKSGSLYTHSNDNIHSAAVSRSSSSPENCTATPDLVGHFEPYYNGKDRTRMPSPDPPPPPLKRSNEYRRQRRLPHPEIATSDGTRNLDEAVQRVSSATGRKIHAEQEGSTPMRDSNDSVMELNRTRRPVQAHDHAPVTVPKINGHGAPMEACQHLNACSCKSRFTANLGPYGDTSAKNGYDLKTGSGG